MEPETPQFTTPSNPEPKKNWFSTHLVLGIVFLLAVIAAAVAGIYYWQERQKANDFTKKFSDTEGPAFRLPDETMNWKTYTNTQYGFELKLPQDWTTSVNNESVAFISAQSKAYIEQNQKNCADTSDNTPCDPERPGFDFLFSPKSAPGVGPESEVIFNGLTFTKYQSEGLLGETNYKISKDNITYNFSVSNDKLVTQILSTFKFIDTNSVVNTSNWRTYSNTKYGFEFKLPNDYKFFEPVLPFPDPFNDSVVSLRGSLSMIIIEYQKLPKTIQEACPKPDKSNANCYQRAIAQEEVITASDNIKKAQINDSVSLFEIFSPKGKIILVGGRKALLTVSSNVQSVGSTASLNWIDEKTNDVVTISAEFIPQSIDEATLTAEYKTFIQILSTFKFTK